MKWCNIDVSLVYIDLSYKSQQANVEWSNLKGLYNFFSINGLNAEENLTRLS